MSPRTCRATAPPPGPARAAPTPDAPGGALAAAEQLTALVILGERDWLGPATRVLASLADGQLATLPRAHHFSTATRVEAIMATLRFLAD